ncbi:hypothetical protein FOL47_010568 [Perkinsus chesapeaki]|uniref:Uncharacterized protein n=1 Tax=Perkinsus chesapeaki TaxID=330153 RepID=A0A7J6L180_PERCH|nr:hypothetical protein FOL47_010568 [Perkinsus chesapeaki]
MSLLLLNRPNGSTIRSNGTMMKACMRSITQFVRLPPFPAKNKSDPVDNDGVSIAVVGVYEKKFVGIDAAEETIKLFHGLREQGDPVRMAFFGVTKQGYIGMRKTYDVEAIKKSGKPEASGDLTGRIWFSLFPVMQLCDIHGIPTVGLGRPPAITNGRTSQAFYKHPREWPRFFYHMIWHSKHLRIETLRGLEIFQKDFPASSEVFYRETAEYLVCDMFYNIMLNQNKPRDIGRKHSKSSLQDRRGNPVYLMFVPIYLHQPVVQLLMKTTPEMYDEVKMAERLRELGIPTVRQGNKLWLIVLMVSIPFAIGFDNLQYYWKKYFTLLESSVGYSDHDFCGTLSSLQETISKITWEGLVADGREIGGETDESVCMRAVGAFQID